MPKTFHVNGVAELSTGTGSAGALELLGHTVNGVEIEPQILKRPIYTDAGGGDDGVPVTHRKVGEIHVVSADVIVYDEAVMAKVRRGTENTTEGVMVGAGTILDNVVVGGTGAHGYYRLLISSPDDGVPWNYLTAHLMRAPRRLSTKETVYRLQWEAIPYVGTGTTMAGVVLFNRVTS
jgi:hypothetical protein